MPLTTGKESAVHLWIPRRQLDRAQYRTVHPPALDRAQYRTVHPPASLSTHSSAHITCVFLPPSAGRQGGRDLREVRLLRHQRRSPQQWASHTGLFLTQGSPLQRPCPNASGQACLYFGRRGLSLARRPTQLGEVRRRTQHCPFQRRVLHTVLAVLRASLRATGEFPLASVRFLSWPFAAPAPRGCSREGCLYGPRLCSLARCAPAQV